ncbi:hypothetical protein EQW76_00560 [Rhizobium sp. rho-13.1]|uniref:hypothetical protein n=1 Tax=Rhizobium sp. rho-13.1 TaxID=2506431 RepID=UPI00115F4DDF|nr:hypothetical protein [Rhizobium sp. rho-13.1]TQX91267.1 hypothetical protein EQW76_00560 [Rhizobium sp. rho-13.1]
MAEEIAVRTHAWTQNGRKVYVTNVTTEGYYVVQGMNAQIYGDEIYEETGDTWVEARLYGQPPVALIDEQITKALAYLEEVKAKHREMTSAVLNVEKENKERLSKLSRFKGLENLEAFIDGKVTHCVVVESHAAKVETVAQALTYYEDRGWGRPQAPSGLKLVTLFGDSKGDLQWRVNQYRDDSGSSSAQIIPCISEEQAQTTRDGVLLQKLRSSVETYRRDNTREHLVLYVLKSMEASGLAVPDDCEADVAKAKQAVIDRQMKVIEEEKAKLAARIAALEVSNG